MENTESAKTILEEVSVDARVEVENKLQMAKDWLKLIEKSSEGATNQMIGPFWISSQIIEVFGDMGWRLTTGTQGWIKFGKINEAGGEGYGVHVVVPEQGVKAHETPGPSVTFTKVTTTRIPREEVRANYLSTGHFIESRSQEERIDSGTFIAKMQEAAERWREEGRASSTSTMEALSKATGVISSVK